jgi:hypothetical protein
MIYHNNLINPNYTIPTREFGEICQVSIYPSGCANVWNDGYLSGGNYWNNYTGVDSHSGPNQDEFGSDGIGDTPHMIDESNLDNYPLMLPYVSNPAPGDLNQDGIVNVLDATQMAPAFGSHARDPTWNQKADINKDDVVNILDAIIMANHFLEHYP